LNSNLKSDVGRSFHRQSVFSRPTLFGLQK
jgi:hypothetical protein